MARSTIRFGAVLLAIYVITAAITASWAPGRMRPLFDGFASHPSQYNWVNPPKEFAQGNQGPDSDSADTVFNADLSRRANATTRDGQILASLPDGSLAPHPPDTAAKISVDPFDSLKLGPLPAGLRAESNAYQVKITYQPSQAPATGLAKAGEIGLTSAAPADTMLFSRDGTTWEPLQGRPLPQVSGLTAPMTETGYYLAASKGQPRAGTTNTGGGPPIILYLAAALVPLGLGYLLLNNRRRPRSNPPRAGRARPSSRPRHPPPRPPAKPKTRKKTKKR